MKKDNEFYFWDLYEIEKNISKISFMKFLDYTLETKGSKAVLNVLKVSGYFISYKDKVDEKNISNTIYIYRRVLRNSEWTNGRIWEDDAILCGTRNHADEVGSYRQYFWSIRGEERKEVSGFSWGRRIPSIDGFGAACTLWDYRNYQKINTILIKISVESCRIRANIWEIYEFLLEFLCGY